MPTTRAIPTEVHYMEPVRPRNCRKDRVRENVFLANAEFDCFTEEEAPVALIVKHYGSRYDEETDEMFYECNETPYRLANGKLYTCYEILEDTDRLQHCGIVCHHCIADGKKEEPRFPLTLLQRDNPISKRLLMKKARRFRLARCCALSTVL